jgi:AraC-like DNA-binding protein
MSKIKTFSELYKTDFNLCDIFAMRQKWTKGTSFSMTKPRRINGIIYLKNCVGRYIDESGNVIDAQKKSVVFLPKGSKYTVFNLDCATSEEDAILIEFNMKTDEDIFVSSPVLLLGKASFEEFELIEKIVSLYETSSTSPIMLKSKLYELIAMLCKNENSANEKYSSIRKGIQMLERNVYENISIEKVASECSVSSAHFRRLFKEYAKKSPVQYRIDLKIEYAKSMLTNSDLSIENISQMLNFESSSYFCRIFKNRVGITPSEYRKTYD